MQMVSASSCSTAAGFLQDDPNIVPYSAWADPRCVTGFRSTSPIRRTTAATWTSSTRPCTTSWPGKRMVPRDRRRRASPRGKPATRRGPRAVHCCGRSPRRRAPLDRRPSRRRLRHPRRPHGPRLPTHRTRRLRRRTGPPPSPPTNPNTVTGTTPRATNTTCASTAISPATPPRRPPSSPPSSSAAGPRGASTTASALRLRRSLPLYLRPPGGPLADGRRAVHPHPLTGSGAPYRVWSV